MSAEVSSTVDACMPVDSEDFVSDPEELESLYAMLEKGIVPDLQWQSPGRRSISPEGVSKVEGNAAAEHAETQGPEKTDFDFSDDVAQPQMRVRSQNSTPKSAKKKTANFAGVMEVLKKKSAESSS